jgi:hypothetical protein
VQRFIGFFVFMLNIGVACFADAGMRLIPAPGGMTTGDVIAQ